MKSPNGPSWTGLMNWHQRHVRISWHHRAGKLDSGNRTRIPDSVPRQCPPDRTWLRNSLTPEKKAPIERSGTGDRGDVGASHGAGK